MSHEYVFTTAFGTPIQGRNILRQFKVLLAKAGIEPGLFNFHSLRHSAAPLMLAQGVPAKVVAETLGHTTVAMTLDTYSHVLPNLQDEAAAKMDDLLGAAAR